MIPLKRRTGKAATHRLLPYLVAVIFLSSCGFSDEEKINMLLDKRIRAFELKDPAIYSECLHKDYKIISGEEVTDKQKLVNRFKDHVSTIDTVSFNESKRYVYINGADAAVLLLFSVDMKIDGYSMTYKTKEVINLSKVLGGWKITKESMFNLLGIITVLDD